MLQRLTQITHLWQSNWRSGPSQEVTWDLSPSSCFLAGPTGKEPLAPQVTVGFMKWLCCIHHFPTLGYGSHLRKQLFPLVTVLECSWLLPAEGIGSPQVTKGSQAEVPLLQQGEEGSSPCLLWHSQGVWCVLGCSLPPFCAALLHRDCMLECERGEHTRLHMPRTLSCLIA